MKAPWAHTTDDHGPGFFESIDTCAHCRAYAVETSRLLHESCEKRLRDAQTRSHSHRGLTMYEAFYATRKS